MTSSRSGGTNPGSADRGSQFLKDDVDSIEGEKSGAEIASTRATRWKLTSGMMNEPTRVWSVTALPDRFTATCPSMQPHRSGRSPLPSFGPVSPAPPGRPFSPTPPWLTNFFGLAPLWSGRRVNPPRFFSNPASQYLTDDL